MKTLVVDDDDLIREMLCEFLVNMGHSVLSAPNGKVASDLISEDGEIQLLITDFRMPEMNGIELLDWCRARQFHFSCYCCYGRFASLESKWVGTL